MCLFFSFLFYSVALTSATASRLISRLIIMYPFFNHVMFMQFPILSLTYVRCCLKYPLDTLRVTYHEDICNMKSQRLFALTPNRVNTNISS